MKRYWIVFLLLLLTNWQLGFATENKSVDKKVTFVTDDGVKLVGLFHPPKNIQNLTFVLLHGLGSDKSEWQSFAKNLSDNGYGYFAFDARGHGESVTKTGGKKISYQEFQQAGPGSQWDKMIGDLGIIVKGLGDKYKIDTTRIGLIGASLGANVALNYAAQSPEIVQVILLSPGLVYAGVGTETVIKKFDKRPVAIAVSMWDSYAYMSSKKLFELIKKNKKAVLFTEPGQGHGVQMFGYGLETKLLEWMKKK